MKNILESNARKYTLLVIAFTFIIRLLIAAYTGLGIGESYYFRGALSFDLSYFDQPPLFFWLGGLSVKLLGLNNLGLRFPSVLLFAGTCWLLYLVTAKLFNARSGFWAVVLINLSAVFTIPIAVWFQPDAPLMFFWMLSTYFIVEMLFKYNSKEKMQQHRGKVYLLWVLIGVSMGLDVLSKYHVLFLLVGVFIFIIANKKQRHWLTHPGLYIAFTIAVALAFPVIWWNYQNDWISFTFQGNRATAGNHGFSLHPEWFLRSIGGQALWLLPWIWIPLVIQLWISFKNRNKSEAYGFIFWTSILPLFFFTLVTLWSDLQYHFHWQAPGYMMLFIPLGFAVDKALNHHGMWSVKFNRRWLTFSVLFTCIVLTAANLQEITGFWRYYGPKWMVHFGGEKTEPTIQGTDYLNIKKRFDKEGWSANNKIFTGSTRWWLTGKIDWALKGQKPIIVFDEDARNLAFLVDPKTLVGDDAVILGQDHQKSIDLNVKPFFDSVTQLPDIIIYRSGVDELHLQVYYCKNFHVSKRPHEEFPVYRQLSGRPPFGK